MARRLEVVYRTVDRWTDPETPAGERLSHYTFKATAYQTQQLLAEEAAKLRASDLIVEVVGDAELFYKDGTGIRSDRSHRVKHVGVVVHLVGTKFGDLRYASDTFNGWEANLRAIALGLEALRKVERYGIARRGEQYAGWAALPPGTPLGSSSERPPMTLDHAAATLAGATDGLVKPADVLAEPDDARMAYRMAAKRWHPDVPGGSPDTWALVDEAWQLLEAHHVRRSGT